MTTVAFLGLGAMGYPMAGHLAGQFETRVWNRTPEKAQQHAAQHGSQACADVAEAVRGAAVLFTCLPTSAEVDALADTVLGAASAGLVWVDCTSGEPAAARALAVRAAQAGVVFLDAPVSGGTSGADAGTLTVMVGGDAGALDGVRPTLAFAAKVVHVGPSGAGFAVKAINNALLAVNLWAAGEGLAALARAGVDVSAALQVINASSGRSNATENLIPQRVVTRAFPVTFKLGLLAKDAGIALRVVNDARASAPVLNAVEGLMRGAANAVGADEDHTAALKLIERLNDQEIR
ncbi:NAD(P)-dependent oxidoreductase [Deinococcus maricopensis]|uniref:3-hydroxyisobutyrate dehydrogenase n=1 Tax=Deinococcus maricopensis (strain DSM 21211 / LMG 22137 / NRRL B-23946 / LB-34) TaxID=709986 RepID=E8U5Y4_DEIML|nr:NAD(P)-dependent oxidoreductase [Deinococcus maricopensis]ADV66473.1 3-hydroxyisobutyrate dehydrogenase [Deinococcus maricopensis DSM 21211]